jgi:hypothetical protein
VQLRFATGLTSDDYVTRQAWQEASLERCPLHPQGGCGFSRHGTYERVNPPGTRIARWYCRQGHCTFSLLPDCLAARWSGTLIEFEAAVNDTEAARSLEAAAASCRPEIELPGVLRWLRRRRRTVTVILVILRGLIPAIFFNHAPTLIDFRRCLGVEWVLLALREVAAEHLARLPPPLGFSPPSGRGGEPSQRRQHRVGPDPPSPAP